jgi:hypothetical protein
MIARTDAYNPDPVTLDWIAASTPDGAPEFAKIQQEEELTTPGVNGRRYRTIFEQYRPFDVECFSDHASFDVALDQQYRAVRLKGRIVDLSWTMAGTTYPGRAIHIAEATARVAPGRTAGTYSTSGSTCVVIATFRLVKMADDGSGLVQA